MLVNPAFVQLTEVSFVKTARHSDLSTVMPNRYSTSCTGTITGRTGVKGTEQFCSCGSRHTGSRRTRLDGVAPVAACGAQELAEMRIAEVKQETDKNHSYLKLGAV